MRNPYITTSSTLPEPFPGDPVDQPIRAEESGNPPPRVKVHTELGVPIWFNPVTAEFSARVGEAVQGKGSTTELHSADFVQLVVRIRQRTLVTPVQGYLVSLNYRDDPDADPLDVRPCTVMEHHPRRFQPYVVRVNEWGRDRHARNGPLKLVERIRAVSDVLLPTAEHLDRVREAQRAVQAEEDRHELTKQELQAAVRTALEAIPRLNARDLKHVQETQQQVALGPEILGVASYVALDDEEEEEDA